MDSIAKFKRYNFSLTEDVSKEIDKLSLSPREFRCSRSDVIKAGIKVLSSLDEKELLLVLKSVRSSGN